MTRFVPNALSAAFLAGLFASFGCVLPGHAQQSAIDQPRLIGQLVAGDFESIPETEHTYLALYAITQALPTAGCQLQEPARSELAPALTTVSERLMQKVGPAGLVFALTGPQAHPQWLQTGSFLAQNPCDSTPAQSLMENSFRFVLSRD